MAEETKRDDKKKPAAEEPKRKKGGGAVGVILPALLAGAAAFGGVKLSQPHVAHAAEAKPEIKPPGPTMQLDPFLVTVMDADKRPHAMKVTVAVEFESSTKEEALKTYVPRTRDACLSHLRTETYERVADSNQMRKELLEQLRAAGVGGVERILITDFVVQ